MGWSSISLVARFYHGDNHCGADVFLSGDRDSLYIVVNKLNLINRYGALILPKLAVAFNFF